jgi:hypothetical protein
LSLSFSRGIGKAIALELGKRYVFPKCGRDIFSSVASHGVLHAESCSGPIAYMLVRFEIQIGNIESIFCSGEVQPGLLSCCCVCFDEREAGTVGMPCLRSTIPSLQIECESNRFSLLVRLAADATSSSTTRAPRTRPRMLPSRSRPSAARPLPSRPTLPSPRRSYLFR